MAVTAISKQIAIVHRIKQIILFALSTQYKMSETKPNMTAKTVAICLTGKNLRILRLKMLSIFFEASSISVKTPPKTNKIKKMIQSGIYHPLLLLFAFASFRPNYNTPRRQKSRICARFETLSRREG